MAATQNLTIDQGASFSTKFLVKNPDGSNKNLTGASARMQFRTSYSDSNIYLDATTLNSKLNIDTGTSICSIDLSDVDTSLLTYSTYFYDIEITESNGNVFRLVQGKVQVNPEITR